MKGETFGLSLSWPTLALGGFRVASKKVTHEFQHKQEYETLIKILKDHQSKSKSHNFERNNQLATPIWTDWSIVKPFLTFSAPIWCYSCVSSSISTKVYVSCAENSTACLVRITRHCSSPSLLL